MLIVSFGGYGDHRKTIGVGSLALAAERKVAQFELKLHELQQRFELLEKKSRQQEQRNAELEAELAKARKTSRNSSKPPSSDIVKPPNHAGQKRCRELFGEQWRIVAKLFYSAIFFAYY